MASGAFPWCAVSGGCQGSSSPPRGPLSSEGLDEILSAARARAGLVHGTCHELRHTCFTRLREGGMAIGALQAQAGHRSIASTRIYLHLGADWLAALAATGVLMTPQPAAAGLITCTIKSTGSCTVGRVGEAVEDATPTEVDEVVATVEETVGGVGAP